MLHKVIHQFGFPVPPAFHVVFVFCQWPFLAREWMSASCQTEPCLGLVHHLRRGDTTGPLLMAFTGGRTGSQSPEHGCLNVCGKTDKSNLTRSKESPILLRRLENASGLLPHEQFRHLRVRPN